MPLRRLYFPGPITLGSSITLDGGTFQHAIRVLRLKPGATLLLFNGDNQEFQATLLQVRRHTATAQIEQVLARSVESPLSILLAQGIAKGSRMDYSLQKAVELGVAAILPLVTQRSSVVDLSRERLFKRHQHWRNIVISACEQCGRNRIPEVLAPIVAIDWLKRYRPDGLSVLLNPQAQRNLRQLDRRQSKVTLLIGPEGGLTDAECALAEATGFIGVRLGPRILRTETAGVAALSAMQLLWGDLGQLN